MVRLRIGSQFSKVEVFPAWARPITWENSGVGACGLSIKLDGQMMDGDSDVWVEEALHTKCPCKQGGLGKIFMLRQGQEGAVQVVIWNEDEDMSSWVGTQREDTRNGSFYGSKCAIMAGAETALDAGAVGEGEEGSDEVVRVRDWVDVDRVVVCGGMVCKVDDGRGMCW